MSFSPWELSVLKLAFHRHDRGKKGYLDRGDIQALLRHVSTTEEERMRRERLRKEKEEEEEEEKAVADELQRKGKRKTTGRTGEEEEGGIGTEGERGGGDGALASLLFSPSNLLLSSLPLPSSSLSSSFSSVASSFYPVEILTSAVHKAVTTGQVIRYNIKNFKFRMNHDYDIITSTSHADVDKERDNSTERDSNSAEKGNENEEDGGDAVVAGTPSRSSSSISLSTTGTATNSTTTSIASSPASRVVATAAAIPATTTTSPLPSGSHDESHSPGELMSLSLVTREIFSSMDVDGDGRISFEELIAFLVAVEQQQYERSVSNRRRSSSQQQRHNGDDGKEKEEDEELVIVAALKVRAHLLCTDACIAAGTTLGLFSMKARAVVGMCFLDPMRLFRDAYFAYDSALRTNHHHHHHHYHHQHHHSHSHTQSHYYYPGTAASSPSSSSSSSTSSGVYHTYSHYSGAATATAAAATATATATTSISSTTVTQHPSLLHSSHSKPPQHTTSITNSVAAADCNLGASIRRHLKAGHSQTSVVMRVGLAVLVDCSIGVCMFLTYARTRAWLQRHTCTLTDFKDYFLDTAGVVVEGGERSVDAATVVIVSAATTVASSYPACRIQQGLERLYGRLHLTQEFRISNATTTTTATACNATRTEEVEEGTAVPSAVSRRLPSPPHTPVKDEGMREVDGQHAVLKQNHRYSSERDSVRWHLLLECLSGLNAGVVVGFLEHGCILHAPRILKRLFGEQTSPPPPTSSAGSPPHHQAASATSSSSSANTAAGSNKGTSHPGKKVSPTTTNVVGVVSESTTTASMGKGAAFSTAPASSSPTHKVAAANATGTKLNPSVTSSSSYSHTTLSLHHPHPHLHPPALPYASLFWRCRAQATAHGAFFGAFYLTRRSISAYNGGTHYTTWRDALTTAAAGCVAGGSYRCVVVPFENYRRLRHIHTWRMAMAHQHFRRTSSGGGSGGRRGVALARSLFQRIGARQLCRELTFGLGNSLAYTMPVTGVAFLAYEAVLIWK